MSWYMHVTTKYKQNQKCSKKPQKLIDFNIFGSVLEAVGWAAEMASGL